LGDDDDGQPAAAGLCPHRRLSAGRGDPAAHQAVSILIIARWCRLILVRRLKIFFRKYFRSSSLSGASRSSPSTSDAVASSHGPLTVPRMSQAATRTRGLFRMRLTFHESAFV